MIVILGRYSKKQDAAEMEQALDLPLIDFHKLITKAVTLDVASIILTQFIYIANILPLPTHQLL